MLETLKGARHVAVDEHDPDACVHRKPTVLSSEHVGGRISVEEPLYAEPPHDTTAHLLGERGQISLGPPIDLLVYSNDDLSVKRYRRLDASDPALGEIRSSWEQSLRQAIKPVPQINFDDTAQREQLGVTFIRDLPKPPAAGSTDR